MDGISKQQRIVAEFARQYYLDHKEPVSVAVVMEHFSLKRSTAEMYVRWLRQTGRLYPVPCFGLQMLREDLPVDCSELRNKFAMNIPLYSEKDLLNGVFRNADDPEHSMLIPRNAVIECENLFGFIMNDDSFFDIGICQGDWLAFARDRHPGFGDLVLAIVPKKKLRLLRFFCDARGRYMLRECRNSEVNFVYNDDCTILGTLMLVTRRFF